MMPAGFDIDALLDLLADKLAMRIVENAGLTNGRVSRSPRLLTVTEAAAYLARTKDAVHHMIADGKLPVVRDGRRVFLDVADLDRWVEDHKEVSQN